MKTALPKKTPGTLLLISGGFDSSVAGKLMQENGVEIKAIHFSQEPFTDNSGELKALALAKKLGLKEITVIDAGEELKEIAEKAYSEYYFVLMKKVLRQPTKPKQS